MRILPTFAAAALALAACGDRSEPKQGSQEPSVSVPIAAEAPPIAGAAPGQLHQYGQNCFGMDARVALGLLGVRGGRADMEPPSAGGVLACRFLDDDGKVVARVVSFPSMALTESASLPDVQAMTGLMSAVARKQPTAFGPSTSGALQGLGGHAGVPLTMFQSGWGAEPKGEIGWLGGSAVVYVQFFGPTLDQAKLFVETQAVKATPGT